MCSVAGKPWAVVTFANAAAAEAAMLELQKTPVNGRKVHVQVPCSPCKRMELSKKSTFCTPEMLEPERFPNGSARKQYAERARTPQPAIAAIPCTSESKDVEVPGLVLERDFVSPDEEIEILAHLDSLQWEAQMSRRVQHFGFTFDYVSRRLLRCTCP